MIWAVILYVWTGRRSSQRFPVCSGISPVSRGGPSFILCGAVSGSLCGQLWRMQRGVTDLHLFWACTVQTQADGYWCEDREPALTWDRPPKPCNKWTQLTHNESTVTNVLSIICSSCQKKGVRRHFCCLQIYLFYIWCLKKLPRAGLALKKTNMLPDTRPNLLFELCHKKNILTVMRIHIIH